MNKFNYLIINIVFVIILLLSSCKTEDKKEIRVTTDPLFSLVPSQHSGVEFSNTLTETQQLNAFTFNYMYNGAGVAIGDINNDGLQDIYFSANQLEDRLYLNKGNLQFEDISKTAGIQSFGGWRNGVTMVDINADGFIDIYVCRGGAFDDSEKNKNLLFVNQKNNTFKEQAELYGIADPGFSMTATFFDYDNDLDLDLYIANRPSKWPVTDEEVVQEKALQEKGKVNEKSGDKFFRNNGNGSFTNVSKESGIFPNYGYGLSVTAGDVNQDGYEDIYVANDFVENDYFYINFGNKKFRESVKQTTLHVPFYSMGADMGDINNDGYEEIFVVEMRPDDYKRSKMSMPPMQPAFFAKLEQEGFANQYMHNIMHYNHGNGFFTDISQMAGIDKTDWSWAALLADFDNDGFKDIYVTNGYKRDVYDRDSGNRLKSFMRANKVDKWQEALNLLPQVKLVNYAFKNNGDLTFTKSMSDWGLRESSFSNGAAVADLDNDGDLDIVVNNIDDKAFIYKNEKANQKPYLRVKLAGPVQNPYGIGAKIWVKQGEEQQYIQLRVSRGYLSSSEPIAHFGLAENSPITELKVKWNNGKVNVINNIEINQLIEIKYSDAINQKEATTETKPVFEEITNPYINPVFYHQENIFDDYRNQVLLPHRMSRLGPRIATGDVNSDGLEDFYVGGAKDQSGQLYFQQKNGYFKANTLAAFENDKAHEDMGCQWFDADKDGDLDLYIVSGGTEEPQGNQYYQDRLYLNDGTGNLSKAEKNVPNTISSGACLLIHDFDGDGDQDIFRAGRCVPEKYPYPPVSYIFINDGNGVFSDRSNEVLRKTELGMVTTAIAVNIDQDPEEEIVLAGEWMPVTVYDIDKGIWKLKNVAGLENTTGWWNIIKAYDFDKDGDQDLICGNLGSNYKFHATVSKPFHVYCNDMDGNGTYDIILAKDDHGTMVPVRGRQCSSEQVPDVAKKFPDYTSFANASLEEIYGPSLKSGLHYKAQVLESVIFINEGAAFKMIKLPNEAQFSAIQNIVIGDFDGDKLTDLFIAGNLFGSEVETTRADASIGLMLRGTAQAFQFRSLNAKKSGIFLPYDIKDVQAIMTPNGQGILTCSNNGPLMFLRAKFMEK